MIKSNKDLEKKQFKVKNNLFQNITINRIIIRARQVEVFDEVTEQMLSLQKKGFVSIRKV